MMMDKKDIENQNMQKDLLLSRTVRALVKAVDAKDNYTKGHSARVAKYSRMIAERMGKSEEELEMIYRAGLLHDVGKIRVPGEVINFPGKLSEEAFTLIRLHPITGYHILNDISENNVFADVARFHHERYDGKGYPNGLAGEQIPEYARIVCVADAYDAMASNRSYRNLLPQSKIRSEIERGKEGQFDPAIADIMLQIIDEDVNYEIKEESISQLKILVVDDESMNTKLVRYALSDVENYVVTDTDSGVAAVELVKKEDFDIILLDIKMPIMDGYETAAAIREFSDVPIVFMSADKPSLNVEKMRSLNIVDFITKPYKTVVLKEILHAVFSSMEV